MRPQFVAGATERLHKGAKPLDAMRNEVSQGGQRYLLLGTKVPEQVLFGMQGVSRLLDLPSLFNFGYLALEYREQFPPNEVGQFLDDVRKGGFDPNRHLREDAVLKGKAEETWWFPASVGNAVELDKLRNQLYIHDDPNYTHGAVRLDMPPAELKAAGIDVFKPTAFDGMMQGWEGDAWWKHSEDPHWGLTKNNTHEAVMKMMAIKTFRHRTLIKPNGVAAAPKAAAPHGAQVANNAPSSKDQKHG